VENDKNEEVRSISCPACGAFWYLVGPLGGGHWGYIQESGPVVPEGDKAQCPECKKTSGLISIGDNKAIWVEEE
jgi:hypothetical protein